jgi:hypothetical protein
MTEAQPPQKHELDDLLKRLEEARGKLIEALEATDPEQFLKETPEGDSIRHAAGRTIDDLNFYYGRLTARALSLPQPPCLQRADPGSLREAVMSLQVAHRRFSNLLHDLLPADLEKVAADQEHGTFTLRQVLELATAQYNMRAQQVQRLAVAAG